MTTVYVIEKNNEIFRIAVTGHSGYNVKGKDILCAGVSALTQSLLLGITDVLNIDIALRIDDSIPLIDFTINTISEIEEGKRATLSAMMGTFKKSIQNIASQSEYKNYIQVVEKEEYNNELSNN